MDELRNNLERVTYLQNVLIARATGTLPDDGQYQAVRRELLESREVGDLVPSFVRSCRDLSQFWGFIKPRFASYAERRQFVWDEFAPLIDRLEGKTAKPSDTPISEGVHAAWSKALDRREGDPEGAITAARTLIETVCKHILDESGTGYGNNRSDLPDLYRLVAKELNLAPNQHTQEVFKQILGGVTSVVNGLAAVRNRLGDAHGQGKAPVRPSTRHAQLAVNLAGAASLFLVESWAARSASDGT